MAGRIGAKFGEKKNVFGAQLKEWRLQQGISLRDFAAKLETAGYWDAVAEGTWGHVEAGRRILSDAELAIALHALKKKFSDLDENLPLGFKKGIKSR